MVIITPSEIFFVLQETQSLFAVTTNPSPALGKRRATACFSRLAVLGICTPASCGLLCVTASLIFQDNILLYGHSGLFICSWVGVFCFDSTLGLSWIMPRVLLVLLALGAFPVGFPDNTEWASLTDAFAEASTAQVCSTCLPVPPP